MNSYRIIEGTYKNEYGKEERKAYYIKEKKKFLGIPYWSYITHTECSWSDCYAVKTEFKSHTDAYEFVLKNLRGREFKEGWSYKVVNEFNCGI